MRKMFALFLLVPAMLLAASSESEPLASGESKLSDVEWDESEIAENGWPAELLPDGFPEAPYSEIYSVERKDNEVTIVMFAEWDVVTDTSNARTRFVDILMDDGYVIYREGDAAFCSLLNKEGVIVRFSDTADPSSHLQSIKSPTGYTYEIRVAKIDIVDIAYLFWEFPSSDTDLGLEEIYFDEWPTDYLPDDFPRPNEEPNTDLKIISMEQRNTGVFITFEGANVDLSTYEQNLYYDHGYMNNGNTLYFNNNGDYVYFYWSSANGMNRQDINKWTIQVNKCNEYVKEG